MTSLHWGEIPPDPVSELFTPDVSEDIEKSMDECCLDEYQNDENELQVEQLKLAPTDPLTLYAISLHKYMNDMVEMIRVTELATEVNLIPEDAKPPMPDLPEISIKHKPNTINYVPKDFTDFSLGKDVDVPELSETVVKKILEKCIAIMFAHIGYETTHQSTFDILTDVLEEFLIRICKRTAEAIEDEENNKCSGFPNAIERVLTEMGLGGVKGLNDYYQSRILKYITVLQKRCKEYDDHYASLLVPKAVSPTGDIGKLIKIEVKTEDSSAAENSELLFTTLDSGGVCSTLEPGYQLLNSLEAEANLQILTETEEEMSTSSPGVVSIPPDTDICDLSPFSKKKRFK